jgi:hypothetical protein
LTRERVSIEDLPPNTVRVAVLQGYQATLDDELCLDAGSQIFMVRSFDDGWGLGVDPNTGKQGAFPLVCIEPSSSSLEDNTAFYDYVSFDSKLNAGEKRNETINLEPPKLEHEKLVYEQETKITRRLSSMVINDLAKNGTRSQMPISAYLKNIGDVNGLNPELIPVNFTKDNYVIRNEFADPETPSHELIMGSDTKKISRRLSSVMAKDLAKNQTQSKVTLGEFLHQAENANLNTPNSSGTVPIDEIEHDMPQNSHDRGTSLKGPDTITIDRSLSSAIMKDLAKGGTRSKVPFSSYIKELDSFGAVDGYNQASIRADTAPDNNFSPNQLPITAFDFENEFNELEVPKNKE